MPVALLSGFLGSGKTTLVNALLRDPRMAKTAVAVNEFGETPLDHELIDHGADRTVVLANGCLCCNLAGDMEGAVMRLFSRREAGEMPQFDRLVIEPSGLADPAPLMQAILRNPVMSRAYRLEAIVTTVDALFIETHLARYAETRKQVALADHLVLTKPDLAGPAAIDRVRALLQSLQPAPIHLAEHGAVDAGEIFPPAFFDPDAPSLAHSPFHSDSFGTEGHLAEVTAISLQADAVPWRRFDAWLRNIRLRHAEHLLRVKGILNIVGVDAPVVVHAIHHVVHPPVVLDGWPGADRSSRLVVIVQRDLAEHIRQSWRAEFGKAE
jgi:G3E family GTPase